LNGKNLNEVFKDFSGTSQTLFRVSLLPVTTMKLVLFFTLLTLFAVVLGYFDVAKEWERFKVAYNKTYSRVSPDQLTTFLNICHSNLLYIPSFRLLKIQRRTAAIKRMQVQFFAKKLSELDIWDWETVLVKVEVPKFVVFLAEYQKATSALSPNFIMSLCANCMEMGVHFTLHNDIKIDCRLESLKCFDLLPREVASEIDPFFRCFLRPVSESEWQENDFSSDHQFLGTLTFSSCGRPEMKLSLNSMRFVPIPETLKSLKTNYEPLFEHSMRVFEYYKKINNLLLPIEKNTTSLHSSQISHSTESKTSQNSEMHTEMKLFLSRIQLYFAEDYKDSCSRGYLLNCNFLIDIMSEIDETKISLKTEDAKVIKTRLTKMVRPFRIFPLVQMRE